MKNRAHTILFSFMCPFAVLAMESQEELMQSTNYDYEVTREALQSNNDFIKKYIAQLLKLENQSATTKSNVEHMQGFNNYNQQLLTCIEQCKKNNNYENFYNTVLIIFPHQKVYTLWIEQLWKKNMIPQDILDNSLLNLGRLTTAHERAKETYLGSVVPLDPEEEAIEIYKKSGELCTLAKQYMDHQAYDPSSHN